MTKILTLFLTLHFTHVVLAQCTKPITDFSSCNYTPLGHRGYPAVYPENSLEGLEELFKRGVKYTEVDVSLTKDGIYVLFHDEPSLFRTTNGSGLLKDYTYAELQQFDAGLWKGAQFANTKIPKLEDALKIAQKYRAHLYLDCKSYSVSAMKTALQNSGADPDRMMPSIGTTYDAFLFRQQLPNTPWVWYSKGELPADVNDDDFYNNCMTLGCYAFEVSEGSTDDAGWETFKNKVHGVGGKVWVFTANIDSHLTQLVSKGVDAIESDRPWEAGRLICNGIGGNNNDSLTTGNWLFNGNLFATHTGSQIRLKKYDNVPVNQQPAFGSCSVLGLPLINNSNKIVMKVPAFDTSNGLMVFNNFRIEDNGILDPSFTVIMDILLPASSAGKWISLYQTNVDNANDADLFIHPNGGVGINQSYHGNVAPDTWNRFVFTVDGTNGYLHKYLNGTYIGSTNITGTRWDVWNSSRSGDDQAFLLFADDDGETAELYMSALQIRNYVMDSNAVQKLGGVSSTGIPMGNPTCFNASLDIALADSTILDYEQKTWHMVIPEQSTADSATLSFKLFDGASANIPENKRISLKNGPYEWTVTSADGLHVQTWKACIRKGAHYTGLSDYTIAARKLWVYPNPANTSITVSYPGEQDALYVIYDITGKEMMRGSFVTNNPINIAQLTPGMYIITINDKHGLKSQRFIAE